MDDLFEWDEAKHLRNLAKHGFGFDQAIRTWEGPVLTLRSRHSDTDGERFTSIGIVDRRTLTVIWTWRDGARRIISAKGARSYEREGHQAYVARRGLQPEG